MTDITFLIISIFTVGCAIASLELRSLIYGSISLMGSLLGIAFFFLLLDSPFVAMFQIAVYVGSIAVLILFTVMLVKRELIFNKIEDPKRKYVGIVLMLVLITGLGSVIIDSGLKFINTNTTPIDFSEIGEDFLTYYWPALIIMALILSSSITGALVLARREDIENEQHTN